MTSSVSLQFGKDLLLAPTEVVLIPKGELKVIKVINTDPHNKKNKGLVFVPTPQEESFFYPCIKWHLYSTTNIKKNFVTT